MSRRRGRPTANLAAMKAAAEGDPVAAFAAALLLMGIEPRGTVVVKPRYVERSLDLPDTIGSGDLGKPADWEHRTTVGDLRREAREAVETRFPEWAQYVSRVLHGKTEDVPPVAVESILAAYELALREARATMPAERPRKAKHKSPDATRRSGQSSAVVVRRPGQKPTVNGVPVSRKFAEAALSDATFDPYHNPRTEAQTPDA